MNGEEVVPERSPYLKLFEERSRVIARPRPITVSISSLYPSRQDQKKRSKNANPVDEINVQVFTSKIRRHRNARLNLVSHTISTPASPNMARSWNIVWLQFKSSIVSNVVACHARELPCYRRQEIYCEMRLLAADTSAICQYPSSEAHQYYEGNVRGCERDILSPSRAAIGSIPGDGGDLS